MAELVLINFLSLNYLFVVSMTISNTSPSDSNTQGQTWKKQTPRTFVWIFLQIGPFSRQFWILERENKKILKKKSSS